MNNYSNFKNYNNPYDNMFYNMMNIEKKVNELYDPYNGYIRGNLFKNLYDPYKSEEPYEVKPMNEQAKLLTDIDALSFAMIDLNLFLDVNPNNTEAINLFNNYREKEKKLCKEYESKYGPLTVDSEFNRKWEWIDMPWPWDN